jgi:hypothetical protein
MIDSASDPSPLEIAPAENPPEDILAPELSPAPLDLDPAVIENSPVLQEWLEHIPNISEEIINDPSFRTRFQLGYAQFPSTGHIGGFQAGVEDVFVWPGTGLTLSGNYAQSWSGDRKNYGAEARYYVLPLGSYVNLAPVLGYRALETPRYDTDGLNIGVRLLLVPSRDGAADMAISQTWLAPGTSEEVGILGLSIGYAVTQHLRLAADLQFQNSNFGQDSQLGLSLQWLL